MRKFLATLLLLVPLASFAAHDFERDSSEKADAATAVITDYPFSIACLVKSENNADAQIIAYVGNGAGLSRAQASLGGSTVGDPAQTSVIDTLGTAATVNTASGYTPGTWHSVVAVHSGVANHVIYIDASGVSDATNIALTSFDRTAIGTRRATAVDASFFDGSIAECGFWTAALTQDEATSLNRRYAPSCVRRASLAAYYPMVNDATSLKDIFGTPTALTLVGSTVVSHPRVINCQ